MGRLLLPMISCRIGRLTVLGGLGTRSLVRLGRCVLVTLSGRTCRRRLRRSLCKRVLILMLRRIMLLSCLLIHLVAAIIPIARALCCLFGIGRGVRASGLVMWRVSVLCCKRLWFLPDGFGQAEPWRCFGLRRLVG